MNPETSWQLMVWMALFLGIRHGFDLDHLATIDAITRTIRDQRCTSKMTGFLFSVGHGIVVSLVSLIIGGGMIQSHIPEWLETFGNAVSIFFLFIFGILNLWNIFRPSKLPLGIQSFFSKKLLPKKMNPFSIMLIGALFAFSFDTISQIALFSISASLMAGWIFSVLIGIVFMMGMMISDGLNGWFVAVLVQRADRASLILSRSVGLSITIFSLGIALIGLLKLLLE